MPNPGPEQTNLGKSHQLPLARKSESYYTTSSLPCQSSLRFLRFRKSSIRRQTFLRLITIQLFSSSISLHSFFQPFNKTIDAAEQENTLHQYTINRTTKLIHSHPVTFTILECYRSLTEQSERPETTAKLQNTNTNTEITLSA